MAEWQHRLDHAVHEATAALVENDDARAVELLSSLVEFGANISANELSIALSVKYAHAVLLLAYANYQLRHEQVAIETINRLDLPAYCNTILPKSLSNAIKHLQAQLAYRQRRYEDAVHIYKSLYYQRNEQGVLESNTELMVNLTASMINATQFAEALQLLDEFVAAHTREANNEVDPMMAEIHLHRSIAAAQCNKIDEALVYADEALLLIKTEHLQQAQSVGGMNVEALTDISAIEFQRAYILQLQKRNDDAKRIYQDLLLRVANVDTILIALIKDNMRALAGQGKPRKLDLDKLSTQQRCVLAHNKATFHYTIGQFDKAKKVVPNARRGRLVVDNTLPVIMLCDDGKFSEALKFLENNSHDTNGMTTGLKRAHVLLLSGKSTEAIALLKELNDKFTELKFRPAVVAVIVSMLNASKNYADAGSFLNSAVNFWRLQSSVEASIIVAILLNSYARFLVDRNQISDAIKVFQQFCDHEQPDYDQKKDLGRYLFRSGSKLLSELDAEYALFLPSPDSELDRLASTKAQSTATAKKRKRIRYPKGFNPSALDNPPPDPERWLPKRERSNYRGKRRKNMKGGTQGSSSSSAAALAATDEVNNRQTAQTTHPQQFPAVLANRKNRKNRRNAS